MPTTEELLVAMRRKLWPVLETVMEAVLTDVRGVLEEAEHQRTQVLAEVAQERAKGLADVAKELAQDNAEVEARWAELHHEAAAMHTHTEKQDGRVEVNIGSHRFETSVQTLRRLPHTFFDAYFSGRYAQDVCSDGSIFVDRDGEHSSYVLEYMRDGVLSVAEPGARPKLSLLRALKREFGFYCIELGKEQATEPEQPEMVYVMGGCGRPGERLSSVERYDVSSGQWIAVAAMSTDRWIFGACAVKGELFAIGGLVKSSRGATSSVEKYSPSSNTWSPVAPLPVARSHHTAIAVGSAIYVLAGYCGGFIANVLKYDSIEDTWSVVAPILKSRLNVSACAVGSDIYVFGGNNDSIEQTSVFKYDTVADTWSTLAPMPHSLVNQSACVRDGLVYLMGQRESTYESFQFDPLSGAWSILAPSVSVNRGLGAQHFILAGSICVAGGTTYSRDVKRYDAVSNTWIAVGDMLEGRWSFCAVSIGSGGSAVEQNIFDSLIAKASI
jgi:hypothetical protein